MKQIKLTLLAVIFSMSMPLLAQIDPPEDPGQGDPVYSTIAIHGVLRDPAGHTVSDGNYSLTFSMYSQLSGGTAIWSETQPSVAVQHGVFSAELGSVTALTTLGFNQQYWVGVTVGTSTELAPRIKLTNSPTAMSVLGVANIFPSTGNVGVGTRSPNAGLHIRTQTATDNLLKIENTNTGSASIVVLHDGKMGINVAQPTEALEVSGNIKLVDGGNVILSDGTVLSSGGGTGNSGTDSEIDEMQAAIDDLIRRLNELEQK